MEQQSDYLNTRDSQLEERAVIRLGLVNGMWSDEDGNRSRSAGNRSAALLTAAQRRVCEQVINVFETGTVEGKYDAISIYKDGPGDRRQITYGRSQTTEYGNLAELIEMYVDANGVYASKLKPYLGQIGISPLVDNNDFKNTLRAAGKSDPIMAETQDKFFEKRYFRRALKWADKNGFVLPLSMLVIYDSYIHSGSIRSDIRSKFAERPPERGGEEEEWIRQYVDARHHWLASHHRPAVRASKYRTKDLAREVAVGNWHLNSLPITANGTPVRGEALRGYLSRSYEEDDYYRPPVASHQLRSAQTDAGFLPNAGLRSTGSDEVILRELAADHDLDMPMELLIDLRNDRYNASRPRYWGIVNFDLHSSKPRCFVFDVVNQTVDTYLCSHGKGSEGPTDDGMANVFSNTPGTGASSLGIYRCAETYQSSVNGYSMRLDGLESSNSNARTRLIVMHGAKYVTPGFAETQGRVGRSRGCPALDHAVVQKVIDQLKLGSLLIHWQTP